MFIVVSVCDVHICADHEITENKCDKALGNWTFREENEILVFNQS